MFKPGDIVIQRKLPTYKLQLGLDYKNSYEIIGRVLEHDIEKCKITLDIYISYGSVDIHTGKCVFNDFGFEKADDSLANQFISYIKKYSQDQDKLYIDFVDSFNKADLETKYKIIEYILTSKIDNKTIFYTNTEN